MNRRHMFRSISTMAAATTLLGLPAHATERCGPTSGLAGCPTGGIPSIEAALGQFRRLPGRTAYMIKVSPPGRAWEARHQANDALFVGSAIKTFILTKFLQLVELGKASEEALLPIDDDIRSPSSPVLLHLTGHMSAQSVLEAMISHSDNTATDAALKIVGPNRVRGFLANRNITSAKIPNSTREMISYFAGAPYGVDVGWKAIKRALETDSFFGSPRSPLNDRQTMKCSAADLVSYYIRALKGDYFTHDSTLTEFKRIQAMADAIPRVVPADTAAYAKGGSIEWLNFNCLCVPGQMVVAGRVPVTFCFTVNWNGPPTTIPTVQAEFVSAAREALLHTARTFG